MNEIQWGELKESLHKYDQVQVQSYLRYVKQLKSDPKTSWANQIAPKQWAYWFEKVAGEGLVLDGKHVTVQAHGQNYSLSYDYIAYKNKMLLAYPETLLDAQLVHEGDTFGFEKDSGSVKYNHIISDPFNQSEDKIIGGYCVVKNSRGEFLTILTRAEIEKHRKVARGDFIWKAWFKEMALKTLIKKACKVHFDDVFQAIEEEDNKQSDPELVNVEVEWKEAVEACKTLEELEAYYKSNAGKGAEFDRLVIEKKKSLTTSA